ncbi:MAG TPA: hypothetical protein VNA19_09080 [Pyrinomonadaceae bacterium]|jgi:hypothetical protein|nr:hypothetical protein [Pyrinomonadaceae bacterium]
MQGIGLREHGIYAFPDGTQVVACTDESGRTVLYYLTDWRLFGGDEVCSEQNAAAFRIFAASPSNLITRLGQPTRWTLRDLSDTGRTAPRQPTPAAAPAPSLTDTSPLLG